MVTSQRPSSRTVLYSSRSVQITVSDTGIGIDSASFRGTDEEGANRAQALREEFGIPEDAFDWAPDAGDYPWRVHAVATVPTLRSGNNGSSEYGPTYQSVLRAVARSAGTLSFSFGDMN